MSHHTARKLALVIGGAVAFTALVGPRVDVTQRGASVRYPVARAGEGGGPGGGTGNDPAAMQKLCAVLGVGAAIVDQAPKSCGVKNPGDLTPTATICSTPDGNNLASGGFRTCEVCVPQTPPTASCEKEVKAKAKVTQSFSMKVYGFTVECEADASFEASASSTVSFANSIWNPVNGTGSDAALPAYYASLVSVAATTKASVQLGGKCKVTPPVGSGGGGGGTLDISCEVGTKGNVFSVSLKREARSCNMKDAAPVDDKADAAVVTEDASTPAMDASSPSPADAGPVPSPMDAAVVDAMVMEAVNR